MDIKDRYRLTKNQETLVQNLKVQYIMDHLIQDEVFNDEQYQEINAEKTDHQKVRKFLELLPTAGPDAYFHFREALEDSYQWLGKQLDETDYAKDNAAKKKSRGRPPFEPVREFREMTRVVGKDQKVLKTWKAFARALGVDDGEVACLEYDVRLHGLGEMVYSVCTCWRSAKGSAATYLAFAKALREIGAASSADIIEGYCKNPYVEDTGCT